MQPSHAHTAQNERRPGHLHLMHRARLHTRWQIGTYCYVTQLEVRDYVPNPNAVDEMMDKIAPSLQKMSDKVSEGIRNVLHAPSGSSRGR